MAKTKKSKAKKTLKERVASVTKRPTKADLAEKELGEKERHYNALGRYIHDARQKLLELRKRWDEGERTTELLQAIAELKLPES